jgi:stage III sporulation protein AB
MLRIIGSVCILLGCSAAGILAGKRLADHEKALGDLLAALTLIESEIVSRLTPIPEAIRIAYQCARADHPCRKFLGECLEKLEKSGPQEFASVWRNAADETLGILPSEERQVLAELSGSLGRYDAEEQAAAIGSVRFRIERFRAAAERERERSAKIYRTLGVTVGIAAVIVLI